MKEAFIRPDQAGGATVKLYDSGECVDEWYAHAEDPNPRQTIPAGYRIVEHEVR